MWTHSKQKNWAMRSPSAAVAPRKPVMLLRSLEELAPMSTRCFKGRSGRTILLVRGTSAIYATDARCFHQGGNLGAGDIEDLGDGRLAIVCPKHALRISLADGSCAGRGVVQRTHAVEFAEDGSVWVQLSSEADAPLPSDAYNISPLSGTVTAAFRARKLLEERVAHVKVPQPALVQTTLAGAWSAAGATAAATPPPPGAESGRLLTTPSEFFGGG